jgi:hypothetical protein
LQSELRVRLSRQRCSIAERTGAFLPVRRCVSLQSMSVHGLLVLKVSGAFVLQPHLSLHGRIPFDLH